MWYWTEGRDGPLQVHQSRRKWEADKGAGGENDEKLPVSLQGSLWLPQPQRSISGVG